MFAFCGVVNEVPVAQGGTGSPCYGCHRWFLWQIGTRGGEEPVHYPAYQVAQSYDGCVRLGVDASTENTRWYLNGSFVVLLFILDNHDPTVGVTYQYVNGDDALCGDGNYRSLAMEMTCKDENHNIPDEEPVYENNCAYMFAIDSIYGCPTECGIYRGSLCGKRGVCKFDLDTRKPHCYCQKGYTGYACNEKGENKAEGFTNTTLILLVVFVMLIVVEIAIILMWNKVKRLRLDPSAYTNFTAADELA